LNLNNKKSKNFAIFYAIFAIVTLNTSCVSNKKLTAIQTLANENKSLKGELDALLLQNKALINQKKTNREIDSVGFIKINTYLDSSSKKADEYSNEIVEGSASKKILFSNNLKSKLSENLDNLKIVSEILKLKTFIRFKTGALFKPGGYVIEDDTWKIALKAFEPVVDSIINFTSAYPKSQFGASIAILGYSDATAISPTGALFQTLIKILNVETAAKDRLNLQLSQLRAESVSVVFSDLLVLKMCKQNLSKNLEINVVQFGRGEELPDPNMDNPLEDDERRRAVVVYWSILPRN
jgi:hypothetical protein